MNTPDPAETESFLARHLGRMPAPMARAASCMVSLIAGLAIAVMLHYLLYRVGLPSKPFIYVAF